MEEERKRVIRIDQNPRSKVWLSTSDVPMSWLNPSSCINASLGLLGSKRDEK